MVEYSKMFFKSVPKMKTCDADKILLVVIVAMTMLDLSLGIATKSCNQEELKSEVTKFTNCLYRAINKNLQNLPTSSETSTENKSCNSTEDGLTSGIACLTGFTRRCLDKHQANAITESTSMLILDCSIPDKQGLIPRLIKFRQNIMEQFGSFKKALQHFIFLLTFEKNCNTAERITLLDSRTYPCYVKLTKGSSMKYDSAISLNNFPEFPLCSVAKAVLGTCFHSNPCFSQSEMHLIRNFTVTAYHTLLGSFVQIKEKFGNLSTFLQANGNMNKEFLDLINDDGYSNLIRSALNLFDPAVEEFNTSNCKNILKNFSMLSITPEITTEQLKMEPLFLDNDLFVSGSTALYKKEFFEKKKILFLFYGAILWKVTYNMD